MPKKKPQIKIKDMNLPKGKASGKEEPKDVKGGDSWNRANDPRNFGSASKSGSSQAGC